uniref:CHRD domain-containing protein n=1 Tax=Altererythrobacter segetis TaxID=1104773 RepID=UPI001407BBA6|nr:CHRD domain-containing protein [Altererythrobacter segetis]
MHAILKAGFVLGGLTLAAAAAAQPSAPTWQPAPSITASLDIGGTGNFTGVFENKRLCYMINAPGVANPTAVRIVALKPEKNGEVLFNLKPPVGGASGDCVPASDEVARRLVKNAGNFALAIDTAAYPNAVWAPLVGMNG